MGDTNLDAFAFVCSAVAVTKPASASASRTAIRNPIAVPFWCQRSVSVAECVAVQHAVCEVVLTRVSTLSFFEISKLMPTLRPAVVE